MDPKITQYILGVMALVSLIGIVILSVLKIEAPSVLAQVVIGALCAVAGIAIPASSTATKPVVPSVATETEIKP